MASGSPADALAALTVDFGKSMAGGQGVVAALGSTYFDEVVFDSQFSPEVKVQPWAPGDPNAPESPASAFVRYARPRVRLRKNGETIKTFAPGGEPNGVWLPNAVGAVAGVASVTSFLLGHTKTAIAAGLVSLGGFGLGYLTRPSS